jgi:hypothetical protein
MIEASWKEQGGRSRDAAQGGRSSLLVVWCADGDVPATSGPLAGGAVNNVGKKVGELQAVKRELWGRTGGCK